LSRLFTQSLHSLHCSFTQDIYYVGQEEEPLDKQSPDKGPATMENGGMAMKKFKFILAILLLGWGIGPSLSTNYAFAALQKATFVVA